jgi:hypothetical protein
VGCGERAASCVNVVIGHQISLQEVTLNGQADRLTLMGR